MEKALYVQILVTCIIAFAILFVSCFKKRGDILSGILSYECALGIVLSLCDLIWYLLLGSTSPSAVAVCWFVNALYMGLSGFTGFFALYFVACRCHSELLEKRLTWARVAVLAPAVLVFVLALTSPWTGLVFIVKPDCTYERGALYWIQPLVSFGYIVASAVWAFIKRKNAELYSDKKKYTTTFLYALIPLIGGIVQVLILPGLPVVTTSISIAIFVLCIDTQDQMITMDGLTGLHNRYSLDNHLVEMASRHQKDTDKSRLYLMFGDIDGFKQINDTFGHVEGDRALKTIAGVLRTICEEEKAMAFRAGGDEFAIVYEAWDDGKGRHISNAIAELLDIAAEKSKYHLTISFGTALYRGGEMTVNQLISEADTKAYKVKAEKKCQSRH